VDRPTEPHHLAAVGRLVNLVSRHQSHVRKQNATAKSVNDVPEHDVADLVKMIRATAAPATSGKSDDDVDRVDDESTSLLPVTTAASKGGRQRRHYRPMSARNVVTLTRLARLMKGGGEGGIDGLASDKLPHVGEVLSAIDRMTSKKIDDNNRDKTSGSEGTSVNDDSGDEATSKLGSSRKEKRTRKRTEKMKVAARSSTRSRDQNIITNREKEEIVRLPASEAQSLSVLPRGDVASVSNKQRQLESAPGPTSSVHSAVPISGGTSQSMATDPGVTRRSTRRSATSDVIDAATAFMTGTHSSAPYAVPNPSPNHKRSTERVSTTIRSTPYAFSEPPTRTARNHPLAVGTDTGHAGAFVIASVHRAYSTAAAGRSHRRSPDTGTGPMMRDK